jgi:uncharacterized BrkB/YihY/UPF0761 family membrane protein
MTSAAEPPRSADSADPSGVGRAVRLRLWTVRLVARARALGDRLPGAHRLLAELSRVEVIDRSLAVGAQALLALLPLLVVVAAYTPTSFGSTVVVQMRDAMGLSDDVIGPLRDVVLPHGQVRSNTGAIGLVVTIVSATSFSRALQRMYARVYDLKRTRRSGAVRSSVVWLFGWLAYLEAVYLLGRSLHDAPGSPVLPALVTLVAQVGIWWWTARLLLLWRVPWSQLLPGALLTTAGMEALFRGSALVMPRFARSSVEQFGSVGVVLAAASWLVAFGGVLVVTTVLGRLLAEQSPWHLLTGRLAGGSSTPQP